MTDSDAGTSECMRDRDCDAPDVCMRDSRSQAQDLEPLILRCDVVRDGGATEGYCIDGAMCGRGICALGGTCVVPCGDNADCTSNERCADVHARTSASTTQSLRACVQRVQVPTDVVVSEEDLPGVLEADAEGDVIAFPASAGTMLAIVEPIEDVELTLLRLSVAAPTPSTLFDRDVLDTKSPPPRNPVDFTREPLTALVPSGSRDATDAASYEMLIRSSGASDVRLTVLSREDTNADTLDIDVFYVGGGGLHPEGVRGPPIVARTIDALDDAFGAFDIRVGDVRQHDVVGGLRTRYEIVDRTGSDSETRDLFRLSAGVRGPSVPLFLVRSIEGALGVSGSTPGPAGIHGTAASGVAIPVDLLASPEERFVRAVTHEIAHFLGLFHTSEQNGIVLESLSDTPECRVTRDANDDGVLSATECAGAGAENLMFWEPTGNALSAHQGAVLRRSMLLR